MIWILTRYVSTYDQYYEDGPYFKCAWTYKPDKLALEKSLPCEEDELYDHILNGGGRRDYEDTWYYLEQVGDGCNLTEDVEG